MAGLPRPVTATDELLLAVHTELVGLRADLAASRGGEPSGTADSTEVEITEPARRRRPPRSTSTE